MSECPLCVDCGVPIDWTFAEDTGFLCDECYQDFIED